MGWWHSVRVRLTLWNVLVLAIVLGGFGAALNYSVGANQAAAIDRDLADRARGLARRPPRPGGGPGGPGGFMGPGPQLRIERRFFGPGDGPPPLIGEPAALPGGGPLGQGQPPSPPPPVEGPNPPPQGAGPDGPPQGQGPSRPGEQWDRRRGDGGPFGGRGAGFRRQLVPRAPGDIGPAPIEANGERLLDFRRPLYFNLQAEAAGMFADDRPWDRAAFDFARRGEERYSTIKVAGENIRVFSTPVWHDGQRVGVVQAAHPLGEQERLAESQSRTLLLLILPAVLVAALGGLFLTNRALQPVRDVTQAAAQIGAGDLSRRLRVTGKDELAQLSLTFNGMISRLEEAFGGLESANQELARAYARLEAAYKEQQRFTGDASHELRTPLTRIKGSTSLALCGPHDADSYREALEVADHAADVMARIVQDLLLLARSDAGQLPVRLQPLGVSEVLRRALGGLQDQPGAPILIEKSAEGPCVMGDPDHLTRLFVNLLENALRHTPADGKISVSARTAADMVEIRVSDTGEGIPAEHLPHVLERFYRVDAARTGGRGGTGLGLAICQSIVQAHGGSLSIQSRHGEGTTVSVLLPLAPAPSPAGLPVEVHA